MKKSITIILLFLLTLTLISCKNEKTDLEEKKSTEEKNIIEEKIVFEKPKPFLYKAKVNSKSGLVLRKENSTKSEKSILIPKNAIVNIVDFTDKFETIKSNKKYDYYGKWVEIQYLQENGNYISGFVFDDFLDYQFKKSSKIFKTTKDTITVTNEKEFLNALSSNRVIWVDTDILNIDTYLNEINVEKHRLIDKNLLIKYYHGEKDLYFDFETYKILGLYNDKSLLIYGYSNIEIRGKNRMVDIVVNNPGTSVLDFNNCSNFLIDNINFYHKDVASCGGKVIIYNKCYNFHIQNVHFDGSGTIGSTIINSNNFNFLNCEFYKNSKYGITLDESSNINLKRCDFHNNNLEQDLFYLSYHQTKPSDINLSECYIKDNKTANSIFNMEVEFEGFTGPVNIKINESKIENNILANHIIDVSLIKNSELIIANSEIINNTSINNKVLIEYNNTHLTFKNTIILNNVDFYSFTNESESIYNQENLNEKNIFNKASDSIATKFNSYKEGDKTVIERNIHMLQYDIETKQLTFKNHLLKGLYKIKFSKRKNSFFNFPVEFKYGFTGQGNIKNGKLEGLWKIKAANSDVVKYQLTYLEGVLQESIEY